jgi:hypothetical protein
MPPEKPLALIRGGGDLGTGVALRLQRAGWRVIITELSQPLVIRRSVAFASAIYDGRLSEGAIGPRIMITSRRPACGKRINFGRRSHRMAASGSDRLTMDHDKRNTGTQIGTRIVALSRFYRWSIVTR